MSQRKLLILSILRNIWIILGVALVLYVLSENIYTGRELNYTADFSQSINKNFEGWYPATRISQRASGQVALLAEPIYLKVYMPIKYEEVTVIGWQDSNVPLRLGLRQSDGSFQFQDITAQNFSITFSLDSVLRQRSKIEFILSSPELSSEKTILLNNNWEFKFSR